jgi:hypothetical protein
MQTATMDVILQRLETLEREKRQVLWVVSILFVAIMVVVCLDSGLLGRERVAEAERFVVKDRQGRVRAELGTDFEGEPRLALRDVEGREQVTLVGRDGSDGSLAFLESGQLRMRLGTFGGGGANLDLFDHSGRSRAGMYLWPDSTVGLNLRNGEQAVDVAAQPDGLAGVSVADARGRVHGRVGSLPEGVAVRTPSDGAFQPPFRLAGPVARPSRGEVSEAFQSEEQYGGLSFAPSAAGFPPIRRD